MDSVFGLLLGGGLVMGIVTLAMLIFMVVCNWRIFEKMGIDGWKCLIPLYNIWCFYDALGWLMGAFLTLGAVGLIILLSILGIFLNSGVFAIIVALFSFLAVLTVSIVSIIGQVKLLQGLGRPLWFLILMIFIFPVYYGLLAFTD